MKKFLCMQRSLKTQTTDDAPREKPSPAQMQEMYAQFGEWQMKFKDNLVDMGGKLGTGKLVTASELKASELKDGPLVEVKELVGGYMIVAAEDLDGAIEVARQCPGLVGPKSGVEVIEIISP